MIFLTRFPLVPDPALGRPARKHRDHGASRGVGLLACSRNPAGITVGMSSLLFNLLSKDDVDVPTLTRIYAGMENASEFLADAIRALHHLDDEQAWRALWLLRRCAEDNDNRLDEDSLIRISDRAGELRHWIARLNLCQLFAATGCPPAVRETLFPVLAACFDDRRVIVKAWAISALNTFARDPNYRDQIAGMLREAKRNPAKSMQARLRHLGPR
jgi:hypothetical protein